MAAPTNSSNLMYDKTLSAGYATGMAINDCGSAAMKSPNSSPVPSRPGRSTKCLRDKSSAFNFRALAENYTGPDPTENKTGR